MSNDSAPSLSIHSPSSRGESGDPKRPAARPNPIPSPRAAALLPAALLLAWACGGSGSDVDTDAFERACQDVPGCAESRSAEAGPRETIYRVQVVRSGSGEITIGRVEAVAVPEGKGVPVGRLAGSHMVVGVDASGDAFGYVRASDGVEEIAVLDDSGQVVARAPAPGPGTAARLPRGDGAGRRPSPAGPTFLAVGLVPAALAQPGAPALPAHCAHVMILEGEADRDLARGVASEDDVRLIQPGPTQRAAIHGGLNLMTPLLCHGVSRIVVGDVPGRPGLGGSRRPGIPPLS